MYQYDSCRVSYCNHNNISSAQCLIYTPPWQGKLWYILTHLTYRVNAQKRVISSNNVTVLKAQGKLKSLYPPQTLFVVGYTVFTLSVCACVRVCVRLCVCLSVRPSVTFCFFNILKSHCWIFIKPCKHVHICKTNTLDKKVRARGQFY